MIFKILLATMIGFILGKERTRQADKAAGGRTMALVMVGSTLLAILSLNLLNDGYDFDFSRLMSYGLVGIGFIGSGIINKGKNQVEGLTTAASLFILMPLGFCIGMGYYFTGIFASIVVYLVLDSKYWGN